MLVCDAIGIVFPHTYIQMQIAFSRKQTLNRTAVCCAISLSLILLLSLDILLFCATFVCGSKATFAFISMRRRMYVHMYVYECAQVCHIIID